MTEGEVVRAILSIAGDHSGCQYKIIRAPVAKPNEGPTTLLIRDDGYRFDYMVLESPAPNTVIGEWIHFAEYKHCEFPRHAGIIAKHFMNAVAIEALES